MISKTKIRVREKRKTDDYIVNTVRAGNKFKEWNKITQYVSGSRRKYSSINLKEIDANVKEGDTIVIVGKVLGSGSITKKIRICALSFSQSAIEKLKENKSEVVLLAEEISKNPKMEGVKVLR